MSDLTLVLVPALCFGAVGAIIFLLAQQFTAYARV